MEAASFFIVFVETYFDCAQHDKNNKKRYSGQQESAPKKLFGYESFVGFHYSSTFITSS